MKKTISKKDSELVKIPSFDFKNSLPNKYFKKYSDNEPVIIQGTKNKIELESDVAEYFPDSESVNNALRSLILAFSKISRRKYFH
jgi:hypothetical protein